MRNDAADRGHAVPLVALVIVVGAAAALVLGLVAGVLVDRARAQTAADAAVLAAAAGSDADAAVLAAANGGTVESLVRVGTLVEVTVRVGRARATARADAVLVRRPPGPSGMATPWPGE